MKYKLLVLIALRQLYNQNKFTKQVQVKLQQQYDFSKIINVMGDVYWEQITNFKAKRKKIYTCLWISLILELLLALRKMAPHWGFHCYFCCYFSFPALTWNVALIHFIDGSDNVLVVTVQLLSHIWLCNPMDSSTAGFPVLHHLLEFAHVLSQWC